MSKIVELVGNRIHEYRTRKKLSQEELADRAGLHTAHLGRIERGEENPTLESIEKIITALGVSLEEFFCFQNDSRNTGESLSEESLSKEILTEETFFDKTVSYLKKMTGDEQKDVYKTVKMLIKWKGKS